MFLADLHLGKILHFRKSGIPVPRAATEENFHEFIQLLNELKPEKVFFLGDLFHSYYNAEWEEFDMLLNHFSEIEFVLIEGNHDVISNYRYEKSRLSVESSFEIGPFLLTHYPLELAEIPEGKFNLCGHLHPAIKLAGKGRQTISLPCFFLKVNQLIFPAFGSFTGNAILKKSKNDRTFVIFNNQIAEK